MTRRPVFPPLVFTIWTIGLVVPLLVFVPLAVVLLHRLCAQHDRSSIYAREALAAAAGIAANTAQIVGAGRHDRRRIGDAVGCDRHRAEARARRPASWRAAPRER